MLGFLCFVTNMNEFLFSLRLRILRGEARRLVRYHPGTKVSIFVEGDERCFTFQYQGGSHKNSDNSPYIEISDQQQFPVLSPWQRSTPRLGKIRGMLFRSSKDIRRNSSLTEEEEGLIQPDW